MVYHMGVPENEIAEIANAASTILPHALYHNLFHATWLK